MTMIEVQQHASSSYAPRTFYNAKSSDLTIAFAVDFAGYLISPTHKCVAIGNRYFGTPVKTYMFVLTSWGVLITVVAFLTAFARIA